MIEIPKLNVLVAIPYLKPDVIDVIRSNENIRFYLDSGAFTAWKAKKEITLDYYCNFVSSLPVQPWRYFTLDVIGDSIRTRRNYDELKVRGFNPVPIFTRGENPEELEYYYSQSDCVAIGGLVGTPGNRGFVKGIMQRIGTRKTHWLGYATNTFLSYYKPYSCDSSRWANGSKFKVLELYKGRGQWIILNKQNFRMRPSQEVINLFNQYDIDYTQFRYEQAWDKPSLNNNILEKLHVKSNTKFMLDIDRELGVKYFLALSSHSQIKEAIRAYNFWMSS